MWMMAHDRRFAIRLALVGLGSGVLSFVFMIPVSAMESRLASQILFRVTPATIFAGLIGACLQRSDGGSAWRVLAFIFASVVAFSASLATAFQLLHVFYYGTFAGSLHFGEFGLPLPVSFGAGFVGAIVILASAFLLFGRKKPGWQSPLDVLMWSAVGGALGTLAWESTEIVGPFGFFTLFALWQTGMAFCIGRTVPHMRDPAG
jgi:hypothetical protein